MSQGKREKLENTLSSLSENQITLLQQAADALSREYIKIERNSESKLVSEKFLKDFGDLLRIHHCYSAQPFTKDKFEYAMERVCKANGMTAKLATTGNPGEDLTVNQEGFSLKTQADSKIAVGKIHISKFMELGKGDWSDKTSDLVGLRDQFFKHMKSYDRIFTLRCLSKNPEKYRYEMVEIPKALFLEAKDGELSMKHNSTQNPKPGYCHVKDGQGKDKYQLYFDGGGERKLQVKHLLKEHCIVHAEWVFSTT